MMTASARWLQTFPELDPRLDPALKALAAGLGELWLPAGTPVFAPGTPCSQYLLVAEGSVRVELLTESGREVVLYRVGPGQSCVLTTSCLLANETYPAVGLAETGVAAFAIPGPVFERTLGESARFRAFVFHRLGERLAEVLRRMEAIAFGDIDRRLAGCLLALADDSGCVHQTHQALAAELGTAREVVTRHLGAFADRGWIAAGRGRVQLLDRAALEAVAGPGGLV